MVSEERKYVLPFQYSVLWSCYQHQWKLVSDKLASRRRIYAFAASITTGLVATTGRSGLLLLIPSIFVLLYAVLSYFHTHTHIAMRPAVMLLYEEVFNDLLGQESIFAMHMLGAGNLKSLVAERHFSGTIRDYTLLLVSIPRRRGD